MTVTLKFVYFSKNFYLFIYPVVTLFLSLGLLSS